MSLRGDHEVLKYGSVFSGIEAATVAWRPLGWEAQWYAEVDPFCCELLNTYYPQVQNFGDVRGIDGAAIKPVDILVGGSPCQQFSIDGPKTGMDSQLGQLALEYLRQEFKRFKAK